MGQAFNPEEFKEIKPKAKFIVGKDAAEVDKKAALFEKTHRVIEIKQRCPNVMILFYYDIEGETYE